MNNLLSDIQFCEFFSHVPGAWIDTRTMKVGYETPFHQHFHTSTPARPLEEIEADLEKIESEIAELLKVR